jgi:hypothetical protein
MRLPCTRRERERERWKESVHLERESFNVMRPRLKKQRRRLFFRSSFSDAATSSRTTISIMTLRTAHSKYPAECHYAECSYTKFHCAECRVVLSPL